MILDRRQFLEGMPALLPLAAPGETRRTRFYILEHYLLEQGSQLPRMHDFFATTLVPTLNRIHKGPAIFLEALVASHMPQVTVVFGIESLDQIWSLSKTMFSDREFTRAFEEWERGEPPYIACDTALLEATDYSPEIAVPEKSPAAPRIFELRTYHSPTARQSKLLHQRFSGPEIKIFHRVGVHPILYTSTVFGDNRPNLTYLIPFENLAAREKAWNAFGADEEWLRVRKESIDRGGQIANRIRISLYKATPYSPVR